MGGEWRCTFESVTSLNLAGDVNKASKGGWGW